MFGVILISNNLLCGKPVCIHRKFIISWNLVRDFPALLRSVKNGGDHDSNWEQKVGEWGGGFLIKLATPYEKCWGKQLLIGVGEEVECP